MIAPLLGAIADAFGVGSALVVFGVLMAAFAFLVRVEELTSSQKMMSKTS
jgi:hypothetical protein